IFYINIPVGIIAALLTLRYVRSPQYKSKTPVSQVDWWGIVCLTVGIASLQYVLEKGQEEDWFNSSLIVTLCVSAFFGLYFLIWLGAYHIIGPSTSAGDFFWILILRGFGMGLLSVPISTMSLSTLQGPQIAQGAAFSGMLRQLGGSFGVALISTFVSRQTQVR